jgi:hypothetical protein
MNNRWITEKPVDAGTVKGRAACGRAGWKIENEHNMGLVVLSKV